MLKIKENFFDRFDQSFRLIKSNFVWLIAPVFVYYFLVYIVFTVLMWTFFLSKIGSIENIENFNIWLFLSDPSVVIIIAVWMFLFLINLLLFIVIILSILKSIKQAVTWEQINIQENIVYWFTRFFSSMKTYWYVFSYVYLIPAIIFIIWGLLLNMWLYKNIDSFTYFWWLTIVASILTLILFAIYRWTKATFALYSAVDNDSFEKDNFNHSVSITNKKWWRVFWNIFLVWMIISLWTSMIESAIWLVLFSASGWWSVLTSWITDIISWGNLEKIISTITEYFQNKSMFYDILKNLISIILQSIWTVFVFTFIYLFYLRLFREDEYFSNKWENIVVGEKNIIEDNIEL